VAAGTLPAGLTLAASTGVISGTPTATGTTSFTVQVSDATAATSTQSLSITVNAGLTITTSTLPGVTQNVSYSTTLAATGGTAPYTWSITAGALPAGLTQAASTGVISGTPTATGTSSFTVQVSDASSATATQPLSIAVSPGGSGGAIALLQSNAVEGSGVSSVSVAFPSANAAGNLIIAFVRMSTATQTVQVTDSAGNTYVDAVSQAQTSDGHQVHVFYAKNVAGQSNTVTATFSASNNHPWVAIYEYSGLNTISPLDKTAYAQGSDASPNSGMAATTTVANELVFAGLGVPNSYTGTVTAGSGYALAQQDAGLSRSANQTAVTGSTGLFAGAFSLSSTTNWTAVLATFQP
jgi:hypothetical protein